VVGQQCVGRRGQVVVFVDLSMIIYHISHVHLPVVACGLVAERSQRILTSPGSSGASTCSRSRW
jgi:hypothetical protein